MITATCNTGDCQQNGIGYNIYGEPPRVECGACHNDCELSEARPDPEMPAMPFPEAPS
jgi:hypothetical protein